MDIPKDIKANPIKAECWEQIAATTSIDATNLQLVRMLCSWTDIAETALAQIGNGKDGARHITVDAPAQGGATREQKAPAIDIYKDACNAILRIRAELGIGQEAGEAPKTTGEGTTLNVIQARFDEMQSTATDRRRA